MMTSFMMGLLSFSKLFLIIAWFRAQGLGSTYSGFPASSFRANARNLFRPLFPRPFAKPFRGSTASVLPRYGVSRSLLSNTLRLTANEKDPSTALGMTKRRKTSSHFFSSRYGSQPPPPFGAPPSRGRSENAASQTSHEEGLRYENTAFPHCHFERKREIFFVCGQAKNVRGADSGKHRAPSESEGRCFMQTAL